MNLEATLSKREEEVAEILAFTKDRSEACEKLFICEGTLASHTYRIYGKLEISSKAELVIWWFTTKLKISQAVIPYFKFLGALLLCIGILKNDNTLIRQKSSRGRYKAEKEYVTSI